MSFFQGSSNVKIDNSNFYKADGDLINITLPVVSATSTKSPLNPPIVNLPRVQAAYNDYQVKKQSGPCFKGTREVLLQEMEEWIHKQGDTRIYILSGLAGIGKSTVAYTVATRADETGLLGASFFFSRGEEDRKNAKMFFTALAHQLCVYNGMFADAIGEALLTERGAAAITKDPQEQLQALILGPLRNMEAPSKTIVIIIDALDECDNRDVPSVLIGLIQLVGHLPSFKVILTTRPKPLIEYHYGSQTNRMVFHLQDIEDKVVGSDIRLYLRHDLSQEQVRAYLHDAREEWHASDEEIELLVLGVGGLFIIASTSVRFILNPKLADPGSRMKKLLDAFAQGRTPLSDLNGFYLVILQDAVDCDDDEIVKCYQAVVGAIVVIQNLLPITTLARLIDRSEKHIQAVLRNLQSIIQLGSNNVPFIYHASFTDYVTDPARCKDDVLRIDPRSHHTQLAIHCFRIMNEHLKQNILNLGDPARFMDNQSGLAHERISDELLLEKISSELRYACVYWAHHLDNAGIENTDLMQALKIFANEHLLHWLETLSWIKNLQSAHRSLGVVLKCLTSASSDLRQLLYDVQRFVIRFYEIIENSALHTYYSALPFTPTESRLYRQYHNEMQHNLCQVRDGAEKWNALLAAPKHGESVQHVQFSPDNTLFASWSPRMLKIWDAATGTPKSQIPVDNLEIASDFSTVASFDDNTLTLYNVRGSIPFANFSTPTEILCVALSPDGRCAAIGSVDGVVCLWDSEKRATITSLDGFAPPEDDDYDDEDDSDDYDEEDDSDNYDDEDDDNDDDDEDDGDDDEDEDDEISVELDILAFSSTGTRLAYRSVAGGIKLCCGINGEFVANLDYQTEAQAGFLYSRDGSMIVAMSEEGTLTLWGSERGQLMGTSEGTGDILAISANGSLLASALYSQVRLWRESRENLLPLPPVSTLPDEITALTFSQDHMLAIGTERNVMLYDVEKQCFISSLLIIEPITLAFSPDCTRLVAGNDDGALHLWDVSSIKAAGSFLSKDDESSVDVTYLAFSQDSHRLACGFRDGKVELWSIKPTKQLVATNKHHMDSVSNLAFSFDGMQFASSSADGSIALWNGGDGTLVETFDSASDPELEAVALSTGILAAATGDGISLWDLKTKALDILKERGSMLLSFSARGELLASYALRRNVVTVFDIVKRTVANSFEVDEDMYTMAFLPDNSQLVIQFIDDFRSFNLATNEVVRGARLDHLSQLPYIPFWHDILVWPCMDSTDGVQHFVRGLFLQHGSCATVLWIPTDIGLLCDNQGSSMIALGCNDGRIIFLQSSTDMVGIQ